MFDNLTVTGVIKCILIQIKAVVTITLEIIIDTKYEIILRQFTQIYYGLISHDYAFSNIFLIIT